VLVTVGDCDVFFLSQVVFLKFGRKRKERMEKNLMIFG
jgi:hypothetical protein